MSQVEGGRPAEAVRRIALVSCGKQKLAVAAPACELYTSNLFQLSARLAKARFDGWYILSAFHGLVEPRDVLNPYDRSLDSMRIREREAWASRVQGKLLALEPGVRAGRGTRPGSAEAKTKVTLFAGGLYADSLRTYLECDTPLAGMGLGARLKWLSEHLAEGR